MAVALVLAGCATGADARDTPAAGSPALASGPAPTHAAPSPTIRSAAPRPTRTATPRPSAHSSTPPTVAPRSVAAPASIAQRAAAAVTYANRHGMTSGVAVLDTRTGTLYRAGNADGYYAGASVVKTLIATRLLLERKMSGNVEALATKMIEQSDNAAAWTLYPRVGRDGLLPWVQAHYGIHIGAPPTMPGIWGSTQISARGLVRFYAAVRHDPRVWPWLARTMHAYHSRSSSGEPNAFGIAVAAPSSAVKNGWDTNRDVKAPTNAIIDTTGFVQGDRYAVAILSEGSGSLYYSGGERVVTAEARLLIARGRVS
ncbi:MAG: hypothetical protein ABI301_07410 [Jatrophihabitantaceae bacterium]